MSTFNHNIQLLWFYSSKAKKLLVIEIRKEKFNQLIVISWNNLTK